MRSKALLVPRTSESEGKHLSRPACALLTAILALSVGALGGIAVRLLSPPRVVVTWNTASEVDTLGFTLYRSDSQAGPFALLLETPIPAGGDPLSGVAYRYEDRQVTWGRTYYYQLEEIEVGGRRIRFPNVIDGWAGLGLRWAVLIGAALAVLTALLCRLIRANAPARVIQP